MPLRCLLAVAAIALITLSGCATTGSGAGNTTYATPAGIGPVRGAGINGY
ncbi:hypothetical protein [Rhizobium grahamii]|nr:hypothetical protein [Rhizobium grahamii]